MYDKVLSTLKTLSPMSLEVLNYIQKEGPVSKNRLLENSGLTLSTLNRVISVLQEIGFVFQVGFSNSTGGRPPLLFDIVPNIYIAGISFGALRYNVTITNFKGTVVFNKQFPMSRTFLPEQFVELATKVLFDSLDENEIPREKVLGLGIGVLGSLDYETLHLTKNVTMYLNENWVDIDICQLFTDATQYYCICDISVDAAALTEQLYSPDKSREKVLYLNCGIALRTGFSSKGQILRKKNGLDASFGHTGINITGEQCVCGNYGCIECYASISAIEKKYFDALKIGRLSSIKKRPEEVTYKDICKAAEEGDSICTEIIHQAAVSIGYGLANYINLLGPNIVIFSGLLINFSPMCYEIAVASTLSRIGDVDILFSRADPNIDALNSGACIMFAEYILRGFKY